MRKYPRFLPILGGVAALAIAIGATPARATVYSVTSDNIGVNCSAGCGTVTVTDNGNNTYSFDIDFTSALVLHSVQSGATRAVGFDLTGASIDPGSTDVTALATSVMFDGFGTYDSAVRCSTVISGNICVPNGQSPSNDLIFIIDAASGQNLAVDGFLAFDVAQASNTSNTGFASVTVSRVVPEPTSLALLSAALLGFGCIRRRGDF